MGKHYYERNKDKVNAKHKAHYAANTNSYRNRDLKNRYNITLVEYHDLLILQDFKCAICNMSETALIKGKVRALSVDHCHKTGKVRGLLCNRCNRSIGLFRDNPDVLHKAIKYLEEENE